MAPNAGSTTIKAIRGTRQVIQPVLDADLVFEDGETEGTCIWVGTSGDVAIQPPDQTASIVMPAVAAGIWHPMPCTRIVAAGTTLGAADIRVGKS